MAIDAATEIVRVSVSECGLYCSLTCLGSPFLCTIIIIICLLSGSLWYWFASEVLAVYTYRITLRNSILL